MTDTLHGRHKQSHFGGGPVSDDHRRKQDAIAEARERRLLGELITLDDIDDD